MLPIVWFFLVVVSFLWILLLYTELRKRARRHVRGCPALLYISPERLDSLITIEPDLKILELGPPREIQAFRMRSRCGSIKLRVW